VGPVIPGGQSSVAEQAAGAGRPGSVGAGTVRRAVAERIGTCIGASSLPDDASVVPTSSTAVM